MPRRDDVDRAVGAARRPLGNGEHCRGNRKGQREPGGAIGSRRRYIVPGTSACRFFAASLPVNHLGLPSRRRVADGKRRGVAALPAPILAALSIVLLSVGAVACGDPTDPQSRLFIAVHVVERLADGSIAPASGVEIQYEVFGRIRGPANPPLLHSFTNSTDGNGLATTTVLFEGASVDDVNLVFVTATHSDGRDRVSARQGRERY